MITGVPGLDDVEDLIAADRDGLLHSAALAGAQARSVAEAVSEGVLDVLGGLRPRSVVIVFGSTATARSAAELVIATIAGRIDVPIVAAPTLPGWIGPLDVVVIAGDDAGDMALADAAARSVRRRAEVVVVAPLEGPLRDALLGNGIDLSPRLRVDSRFRMIGFVCALVAVLGSLTEVRFTGRSPDLSALADRLDEEAASGHPGRETFHNSTKLLAGRFGSGTPVIAGDSPAGSVVAEHSARQLFAVSGIVCATANLVGAVQVVRAAAERTGVGVEDAIFYDPEFDGPPPATVPRVFVVTTSRREWTTRQRVAALGDVEIITADAEAAPADPAGAAVGVGDEPSVDSPAELTSLLLALLRIEMAAVYLRLIGK